MSWRYQHLRRNLRRHWLCGADAMGGLLRDDSGAEGHGVLTNFADVNAAWVPDDSGYALQLDGTDDHVLIGDIDSLNGELTFTVACWVKPGSVASRQILVHKFATGQGFSLEINSGDLRAFVAQDGLDGGGNFIAGAHGMSTGVWYHVGFVYQGSGSILTVNGASIGASITGSFGAAVVDGSQSLAIGATATATLPLNGALDDIAIWNRAVQIEQMSELASHRGHLSEREQTGEWLWGFVASATTRRLGVIGGGVHYSGVG